MVGILAFGRILVEGVTMKKWKKILFTMAVMALGGHEISAQTKTDLGPKLAPRAVAPTSLPTKSSKTEGTVIKVDTIEVVPAEGRIPDMRPVGHAAMESGPACQGNCGQIQDNYPCPTVYGFGDFLYLTARGADLPFAQARDGVGPLAVPMGPVAIVDPDYSAGFRLGAGVRVGQNSFLQAAFTWWDNSSVQTAAAPAGTVLRSLVVFPATLNAAADSLAARSRQDFNFRLADADFRHILIEGENHYLGYILGARYAHLDQDSRSEFSILGATTVTTNINFDGAGGRAGLEGEYCVKGGFYTYGRGVLSLLAGHFGSNYQQRNVLAGLQARTSTEEDRVVPNVEFEVGGGWSNSSGKVRLQAGYYLSSWYNTLTTPTLIQGVQNTNFTTNMDNFRDTLTFDGLTFRVEFRY